MDLDLLMGVAWSDNGLGCGGVTTSTSMKGFCQAKVAVPAPAEIARMSCAICARTVMSRSPETLNQAPDSAASKVHTKAMRNRLPRNAMLMQKGAEPCQEFVRW
ncbi:hypothetical protein MRB53_037137 [Persea americana]|nr:hypothetical protein MRB53_037137 [Persea americana]